MIESRATTTTWLQDYVKPLAFGLHESIFVLYGYAFYEKLASTMVMHRGTSFRLARFPPKTWDQSNFGNLLLALQSRQVDQTDPSTSSYSRFLYIQSPFALSNPASSTLSIPPSLPVPAPHPNLNPHPHKRFQKQRLPPSPTTLLPTTPGPFSLNNENTHYLVFNYPSVSLHNSNSNNPFYTAKRPPFVTYRAHF